MTSRIRESTASILCRAPALLGALSLLAGGASAQVWEVGNQLLVGHQAPQPGDLPLYGRTLAVGDFDGDGVDDLAVGAPEHDTATLADVGRIEIYRGNLDGGLTFVLAVPPLVGGSYENGAALAAGNFDSTPQDELVIGVPGVQDGAATAAGAISVVSFLAPGPQIRAILDVTQLLLAGEVPDENDAFGRSLAVGDFDGDGFDDLAIGAPGKDTATLSRAGKVFALFGAAPGLALTGHQSWFAGVPQEFSAYGRALAVGDFDNDSFDDLAVGEPFASFAGSNSAGRVEVLSGSAAGLELDLPSRDFFHQGSFGLTIESGDLFGLALAAGGFDCIASLLSGIDCADDLAIGSPGEDIGAVLDAGHVVVAYGVDGGGLGTAGAQLVDQLLLGGNVEADDNFGLALAAGQLGEGGAAAPEDLAIGVPLEGFLTGVDDGAVHLPLGSPAGLDLAGAQLFGQFTGLASAPAEPEDEFGRALAIGDFDGDGVGDLAVGVALDGAALSGAVQVLYGALFADGFGRGSTTNWSLSQP